MTGVFVDGRVTGRTYTNPATGELGIELEAGMVTIRTTLTPESASTLARALVDWYGVSILQDPTTSIGD
jgi:hypothetical protein